MDLPKLTCITYILNIYHWINMDYQFFVAWVSNGFARRVVGHFGQNQGGHKKGDPAKPPRMNYGLMF